MSTQGKPIDRDAILKQAEDLVRLSSRQKEPEILETINKLEQLAGMHLDDWEIALQYSRGLVNLNDVQEDEQSRMFAISRLEQFAAIFQGRPEFTVELAKGLLNVSREQEEQMKFLSLSRLEQLAAQYPQVKELLTTGSDHEKIKNAAADFLEEE